MQKGRKNNFKTISFLFCIEFVDSLNEQIGSISEIISVAFFQHFLLFKSMFFLKLKKKKQINNI